MKVTGKVKNVHKCVVKNLHQGVITQCQFSIHAFDCLFLLAEIPHSEKVSEWY